jgi:hypothetical protein
VPQVGQQRGLSLFALSRGASFSIRCVQLVFAAVQLHPNTSFGSHQRLAKRVHLGVDILEVENGLGYFLAQDLRVATANAVDERFQGGKPNLQRSRCLFVCQVRSSAVIAEEGPQGVEGFGFASAVCSCCRRRVVRPSSSRAQRAS